MSNQSIIRVSAFLLAAAVAIGAFGAHALEEILSPERIKIWETAVFYHTWNALGVMLMAVIEKQRSTVIKSAPLLILGGIFIFSGSLYALCLSDIGLFGAITPIGGLLLIAGWIVFGWKVVSKKQPT